MRHLNKIIFLNSANIPYAEVLLDGNVHFAGTQGVGKSTVLRALLFFYNADKMRLGIQTGQKSFEEFYFKFSKSHSRKFTDELLDNLLIGILFAK